MLNLDSSSHLSHLLRDSARRYPSRPAVEEESGRVVTYAELDRLADRLATRLARWGVGRGDRIGILMPKSIESVAAIQGILRSGSAYVPVDAFAPMSRAVEIFSQAGVKALFLSAEFAGAVREAWQGPGPQPRLILIGDGPLGHEDSLWDEVIADDSPSPLSPPRVADDLAYVLFTSGSTGKPKGVMLSHENAFTFLDWCESAFRFGEHDRFSSHAPFHFDLSIFDIHVCMRHAGTLVLIGESLGKDPARLGEFLAERPLDVWYSAPSILNLLVAHGKIDREGFPAPRLVLFAGEVFPIAGLRRLRRLWPDSVLWNLYGPTETNVCTAFQVPAEIADEDESPLPIGPVCPPLLARVVDETGRDVEPGSMGELVIAGPGVMRGYFARPDLTLSAFFKDDEGRDWYRTGDLVRDAGDGCFVFHGRRDRMVKKRGYRIELGEVESALDSHGEVHRSAVIARQDDEAGLILSAFIALKPDGKKSVIAMKRHCTTKLPSYMVPDTITFLPALPMTSTDKVDYQRLKQLA